MSVWTHAICAEDYARLYPNNDPAKMKEPQAEDCCICGGLTESGIYVRLKPKASMFCNHERNNLVESAD